MRRDLLARGPSTVLASSGPPPPPLEGFVGARHQLSGQRESAQAGRHVGGVPRGVCHEVALEGRSADRVPTLDVPQDRVDALRRVGVGDGAQDLLAHEGVGHQPEPCRRTVLADTRHGPREGARGAGHHPPAIEFVSVSRPTDSGGRTAMTYATAPPGSCPTSEASVASRSASQSATSRAASARE